MSLTSIDPQDLILRPHGLFNHQWLLLSAGDFASGDFNCMTISWGSIGTLWNKPFVQVVVRPTRATYHFIESAPDFTLCAFPPEYHKDLAWLGSHSARDGAKLPHTSLSACRANQVLSPAYEQAELILECRKIYSDDFDPQRFLDPKLEGHYPEKDYHRIYFGEILAVQGIATYLASN